LKYLAAIHGYELDADAERTRKNMRHFNIQADEFSLSIKETSVVSPTLLYIWRFWS